MCRRLPVSIYLAILVTALISVTWVGCALYRPPWERYDRIPLPRVLEALRGEQESYAQRHGAPDIVWDFGYGMTVWSYCQQEITIRTISFDQKGRVLQRRIAPADDPRGLIGCAWLCRPASPE